MLLKALHCRRLSLASHTAAFLMWQSDWIKPCTDTVWYLSDYVLLHHPRGWLCMKFSADTFPFVFNPTLFMIPNHRETLVSWMLTLYTSLFPNFWWSGCIRTCSGPALLVTNSDTWYSPRCWTALRCRKLLQSLICQVMPALLSAC